MHAPNIPKPFSSRPFLWALLLALGAARAALESASNSTTFGEVKIYPYSSFKNYGPPENPFAVIDKAFLEGFNPFKKYNAAAGYLTSKDPNKRVANYIESTDYYDVISRVFGDINYFQNLQRHFTSKESLYIRNSQIHAFVTMLNMANKPLYIREEGLYRPESYINQVISLYEIFSLDEKQKIPMSEKVRTELDMTKRECFKENLRALVQNNPAVSSKYADTLRDILHNKRMSLMTEVPAKKIHKKAWVEWALTRPNNKDVFWYLYTALCNSSQDRNRYKAVAIYLEEAFIFGKRGVRIFFSKRGRPSKVAIALTEYLVYRNAFSVNSIEISVDEGVKVPEMQFSSLLDMFGMAQYVTIRSLGNRCKIDTNLPLVNIVLDFEKKRQEQERAQVLKGFFIEDYLSLNSFAKSQMLRLPLTGVGYLAELDRKRCCLDPSSPCLFEVENRGPNFLGKFSIPEAQKDAVVQIAAPHWIFFKNNTVEALKNLKEAVVSVTTDNLAPEYERSSLNTILRENMNVRKVRLVKVGSGRGSAVVRMFEKLLEIKSLDEIDISAVEIGTRDIFRVIKGADGSGANKTAIKTFSFTYSEPPSQTAYAYNVHGGIPSLISNILEEFPSLTTLNVHIGQTSSGIYNFIRDIKYAIGCRNYPVGKLAEIVDVKIPLPLKLASRASCSTILAQTLNDLKHVAGSVFSSATTCPDGADSSSLKSMTLPEFMLSLQNIFKKGVCTVSNEEF